jgi:hypothetical protein
MMGHKVWRNFRELRTGVVHQEAYSPGPIGQGQPCAEAPPASIMKKLGEV